MFTPEKEELNVSPLTGRIEAAARGVSSGYTSV